MKSPATVYPPAAGRSFAFGSRRDFLRAAAVGGAAVAIPGFLSSCKVGDGVSIQSQGTGPVLTIDFAAGDVAFLKFLSVYKQVQADFYTKVVAAFATSDLTPAEQALITDIKNHEVIHRETINGILGAANAVPVTTNFGTTNFKSAAVVMPEAVNFEDLSIGLYNGMLQRLISAPNIAFLLEIQSVEARHSAALRDDRLPKSGASTGYSPGTSDGAYPLSLVGVQLQPLLVETLHYTNPPAGL